MAKYVNNNIVNLNGNIDYDDAVREIAALLGVGTRSDGKYHLPDLCVSSRINMWARYKPEEYPTPANLNEAQRNENGYGIIITGADNITIKTLANIHNAQFTYKKVTGWKRLRDFHGYAHIANPKPYATFGASEGYYNDADLSLGGLNVNMSYNDDGNTGVDFTYRMIGNESLDNVLKRAFPCILMTKKSNGKSYFTALDYIGNGVENPSYRPLKVLDSLAQNAWMVKLSKKRMNGVDEMSSPFGAESVTASLFLMQSASTSAPLLVTSGTNFGTHWIEVSNNVNAMYTPIVVPGAIGQTISLKQYFNGIIFAPTSVSAFNLTAGQPVRFNVGMSEITGASSTNTISVRVTITLNKNGSPQGSEYIERTYNGWPSTQIANLITFSNLLHVAGSTYSGTATIRTTDGSAVNSRSIDFTING